MFRAAAAGSRRVLLGVAWALWAGRALAEGALEAPDTPPPGHVAEPLWEVGAIALATDFPPYPGSDQNVAGARVVPYAVYRGDLWRVDQGSLGLRALKWSRTEWDLSAGGSFGGAGSQVHARAGMPAIGWLGEIGPALRIQLGDLVDPRVDMHRTQLQLPLRMVLRAHGGVSYQGLTFEPRLNHTAWHDEGREVEVSFGLLACDRRLAQLFYGVEPGYATVDRPAYAAHPGLVSTRWGTGLRQRLGHTLQLHWFAQVESLRGAANADSPLVRARWDGGVGVSLSWRVWHASEFGYE